MKKKCCFAGKEIPFSELRTQLDYARAISSDISEVFSSKMPQITDILNEYATVRTKLSMLQDFLFQAKLWCDTIMPEDDCTNENTDCYEEDK